MTDTARRAASVSAFGLNPFPDATYTAVEWWELNL